MSPAALSVRTMWVRMLIGCVFIATGLAGCAGGNADRPLPKMTSGGPPTSTVAVARQDVTSVVTLDATVVASPDFVVTAPAAGAVGFTPEKTGVVALVQGEQEAMPVTLPVNATLTRELVPDGALVPVGLPVAEAHYVGFALSATIPPSTLYRFYGGLSSVRGQVERGPGPFDCQLLGTPSPASSVSARQVEAPQADAGAQGVAPSPPADGGSGSQLSCAPPSGLELLIGSPAIVAVTTGNVANALVLPVEAVAGLTARGTVTLDVGGGRTENRDVTLGITDGSVVEIQHGLSDGDRVMIPSPNLPAG